MAGRYLIGTVSSTWASEFLPQRERSPALLCFDVQGPTDLVVKPQDDWDSITGQLPEDWQPDAIVLYLQYRQVPTAIFSAPVPVIAMAGDWNLQWHAYRRVLRHCDLVLTDTSGVEAMRREGIENVRAMNLFGFGRSWNDFAWPEGERDIDVLFVGNFHPAVQRERLPWLAKLAELHPRWNVRIVSGIFDDEYRRLLARSRIVFNRSIRGECNNRVGEAIASGALLFQEAENREVRSLLKDGEECIFYSEEDLLPLLQRYLENEDERRRITSNARRRLAEFSFERNWQTQMDLIEGEMPALRERAERRVARGDAIEVRTRAWMQLSSTFGGDASLRSDLTSAMRERPREPHVSNSLGALASSAPTSQDRIDAANAFQDAWLADPRHVVAGLNLAETLVVLGQPQHATEQALRTLAMVDGLDLPAADVLDAPHVPAGFDWFRVEWERAAWMNAGDPVAEVQAKITLLRWRLHSLLAQLHDDLPHAFIAASLRPDLPVSQASLGCALARKGRIREAIPYLQQAVAANPFDTDAARACFEAYRQTGLAELCQRLANARRKLAAAAPALIAPEPWFTAAITPPVPVESKTASPLRIVWHGSQEALHSLAGVNREICSRLIKRGHELSLRPARLGDPPGTRVPLSESMRAALTKKLAAPADVHIAHQWPPVFTPPADGHWVIMQPWEFGSLPRAWLEPMSQLVDEVWVPSHYVRDSYVQSGLPEDRVHVVPNGVAEVFFRTGQSPYPLRTTKRFKFLFVGGTIERKGIDLLLKAYTQTFNDKDDVCLVVKDMGVGTFYQGQTAERMIEQVRQAPHAPEIEYLNQELSGEEMASLYVACDCLAHPYRGEGFGLPIAEAMACGLPVIVTGFGAALDFCSDENAYLLPATIARFRDKRVGDLETVDHPSWAEPDLDMLRYRLRYVVEHPHEAQANAASARDFIRTHFTWDHTLAVVETRLAELRQRAIRRKGLRYEPAPAPAPKPDAVYPRPRVSLAMIVKNEEVNLPACLDSVADLVDEIVIVDTGSTDRTKQIAIERGARVFDFPWIDSFSAARNESLRHATGEWVFWMDADDRLDAENRQRLRQLFAQLPNENVGFVMKCLCLPDPETGTATVVDHVRLFRNHPDIRWKYRIHEQILIAIRKQGGTVRWSDVVIHHVGYQDRAVRKRKLQRDLRLLTQEYQEQPEDAFTLFNLASVYQEQGKTAEALDLFRRSLQRSATEDSIVRKLYAQIIQCERHLRRANEALHACEEARRHYPDDQEILFQEALVRRDFGDRTGAIACLERILVRRDGQHFASIDTGLAGYKTRHNLAVFLQEENRLDEAEQHWRLAIEEQPNFLPALTGLAEIFLSRRDWPAFESFVTRLRQTNKGDLEADTLSARRHLAECNFTLARLTVEKAIAANPATIWPRVILTHVLLQEAKDWSAAEQSLRDVLLLDPNHAEAQRNLEVLRHQNKQKSA